MKKISLKELKKTKEMLLNSQEINNKILNEDLKLNLQFLKNEQCFGNDTEKLNIIKKYGTKAAITDFAILLGGSVNYYYYNWEGKNLKNRTGEYWIETNNEFNKVCVVDYCGFSSWSSVTQRIFGARLTLPYSSISMFFPNEIREKKEIFEIEFGEYPKSVVPDDVQKILEGLYSQNKLLSTSKVYTTDLRKWNEYDKEFLKQEHIEYEYNGKKYVRVKANFFKVWEDYVILSNGIKYKNDDYVWVEVEPIKWLVDEEADIVLTKDIIFAGVQFDKDGNYKGIFSITDIKGFMDKYLSKEIIQNKVHVNVKNVVNHENSVATATHKDAQDLINEAEQVLEKYNTYQKKLNL